MLVRVEDVDDAGLEHRFACEQRLRRLLMLREKVDQRIRRRLQEPRAERESNDDEERAAREDQRASHRGKPHDVDGVRADEEKRRRRERVVGAETPADVAPRGALEREEDRPERDDPRDPFAFLPLRAPVACERGPGDRADQRPPPRQDGDDHEREQDPRPHGVVHVHRAVVPEDGVRQRGVADHRQREWRPRELERASSLGRCRGD